jgi:drug/metabolite transporter (DMT)-like permease
MALLAASWGLVAVLVVAVELEATVLTFARLAVAAGTLALVAVLAGRTRLLRPRGRLARLALLGAVQAAHWLLFFEAAKRGSVALAVVTFYAAPVLIALIAPLVLPERTTPAVLVALVAGGVGIGLVALEGGGDGQAASAAAIACGLGSAALYAVLVLLSRRLLLADVPALTIAFWDCAIGALVVAPLLVTAGRVLPVDAAEVGAVLVIGVVFTGVSTLVYAALLRHVTAQVAGLLTFLEPVTGILLAAALLGQRVGPATAVGALLVLVAGAVAVVTGPVGVRVADAPAGVGSGSP